jgi:rubrerythrin
MLAHLTIGDTIFRKNEGGDVQKLYGKSRSMNSIQTICVSIIAIILILTYMTGCGVSIDVAQSLDRGIIINSTLEACRDVKVLRSPSRSVFSVSGILAGQTAEVGFSPTDLLDEKAVISWTVGSQSHRVHLLLPKTDMSGPAALAYQLLPDGLATVHVASLSGLRDTGLPRSTDLRSPNKHSMAARTTVDDVLKFAIAAEERAEKFYTRLSGKMKTPETREALLRFAGAERMHKGKLLAIRARGPVIGSSGEEVTNLEISDYIVDVKPKPDMQYQDSLLLAIKKERAAQRLYTALAALADDDEIKSLFQNLAQEEAKHELHLKTEVISHIRRGAASRTKGTQK